MTHIRRPRTFFDTSLGLLYCPGVNLVGFGAEFTNHKMKTQNVEHVEIEHGQNFTEKPGVSLHA
jgi:hypothetical protein